MLTCVEICAGAGGQAIGLDMAGFEHVALIEYESEQYIKMAKTDVEDFKNSMYFLLSNGIKGYKKLSLKHLIDNYVFKLGEDRFFKLIEKINVP